MKIALLGYGKMGKEIEKVALQRHHTISFIADEHNSNFNPSQLTVADVAIEFSTPESAVNNMYKCFSSNLPHSKKGIPVVVGTTGWYDKFEEIKKISANQNQAVFCSSNFSIGVNIFFELNKKLAQMMNLHKDYNVSMEEIHHTQKLDAPSGTAITLANDIISNFDAKKKWVSVLKEVKGNLAESPDELIQKSAKVNSADIEISSVRKDNIPGIHMVKYDSEIDSIEICHSAKNRIGFATGALIAAEWLIGKTGVFGMKDLLKL